MGGGLARLISWRYNLNMIVIIFVVILTILLTILRRKLGYFGLVMMSGAILDLYWNKEVVDFLTTSSLRIPGSVISGVVSMCLILAPAFLVISKDQKRASLLSGLIPAGLMSVVAAALCLVALGRVFVFDSLSVELAKIISVNIKFIILAGAVWSIFSVLSTSNKKSDKKP